MAGKWPFVLVASNSEPFAANMLSDNHRYVLIISPNLVGFRKKKQHQLDNLASNAVDLCYLLGESGVPLILAWATYSQFFKIKKIQYED
jgi:predicted ATP-grasp superfamily ATP-dependent carboligase